MKRTIAVLAAIFVSLGIFCSCGKSSEKSEKSKSESYMLPEDKIVPTEEINLETAKSEDSLFGSYKNDTYTMDIEAGENDMTVFTVRSNIKDRVSYEWVIKGSYSPSGNLVNYFSAVKTEIVYDRNGDEKEREVIYDNGSGRMLFTGENRVIWKNSFEDIEDNEFVRS